MSTVLRIDGNTSLPAERVIWALNELVEIRGGPLSPQRTIRPEFVVHALAGGVLGTYPIEMFRRTPMSHEADPV